MSNNFREETIAQLRLMLDGWGDGLDLDTPFHWAIDGLQQPVPFFEHLPALLPPDAILYVEGTRIASEVAAFYSSHHARNAVAVARDRIAPAPDIYHFSFSPDVARRLRHFSEHLPVAEMFDHLKAYQGQTLLFLFHDAFNNTLRVSDHIPGDIVAHFCQALGVSSRREKTGKRDPEMLRKALWAFEHPGEPYAPERPESRLGRAWRWLTRQ